MAHDVFISYSSKDKTIVDAIANHLENDKIRCWYADRDIPAGEDWAESIVKALETARVFVLVFTDYSNASKQVLREVDTAVNLGIPIIPFKLTANDPSGGMKYYLSTVHWLDAMNDDLEKSIASLSDMAGKLLSGDSASISSQKSVLSPKKKSKAPLIIGIAAGVLAAAALGFFMLKPNLSADPTAASVQTEEPFTFDIQDGENVEISNSIEHPLTLFMPDVDIDKNADNPLVTMTYGGYKILYTDFAVTDGFDMEAISAKIVDKGLIMFSGDWNDDRVRTTVICGGQQYDLPDEYLLMSIQTSIDYSVGDSGGAFAQTKFEYGMNAEDLFRSGKKIYVPFAALDENNEVLAIAICALVITE